jgi:hypothetical protein
MNKKRNLRLLQLITTGLLALLADAAHAQVYINEIFFNPPNPPLGEDSTREFIEIRGTPNMSLANHYLIFVDSDINNGQFPGSAGVIEGIFNLGSSTDCPSCALGSNGFLTIRQKNGNYPVAASGSTNLMNHYSGTGLPNTGFGSGITSTVGASDRNTYDNVSNGEIESGFTAMLIRVNAGGSPPTLGLDLDQNNDGLDNPTGRPNWSILDSIGVSEPDPGTGAGGAYNAYYYAKINYGTEAVDLNPISPTFFDPHDPTGPHMAADATYVQLGFHEAEYAARWGNSTGQTAADWHVAGTTDNAGSGYQTGSWNFRTSTDAAHPAPNASNLPPNYPNPLPPPTSTQGVPYGTILTNTLGSPNFLLGDYNKDGNANIADYVVWRKNVGGTGTDLADNPSDGDHDYVVGANDYVLWREHFRQPLNGASPGSSAELSSNALPEPAGWILAVLGALGGVRFKRPRFASPRLFSSPVCCV